MLQSKRKTWDSKETWQVDPEAEKWRSKVDETLMQFTADIATVKARLTPVESGVANFKKFQMRGDKFFDRYEAIEEEREKRRKRIIAVLAIVVPVVIGLVSLIGDVMWSSNVKPILDDIREDIRIHQSEMSKQPTNFTSK
jgi:hypothetical protein